MVPWYIVTPEAGTVAGPFKLRCLAQAEAERVVVVPPVAHPRAQARVARAGRRSVLHAEPHPHPPRPHQRLDLTHRPRLMECHKPLYTGGVAHGNIHRPPALEGPSIDPPIEAPIGPYPLFE
jgi:hypothetical protein